MYYLPINRPLRASVKVINALPYFRIWRAYFRFDNLGLTDVGRCRAPFVVDLKNLAARRQTGFGKLGIELLDCGDDRLVADRDVGIEVSRRHHRQQRDAVAEVCFRRRDNVAHDALSGAGLDGTHRNPARWGISLAVALLARRQPADHRWMDSIAARDRDQRLAGSPPFDCLATLEGRQLWLATELRPSCHSAPSALASSFPDEISFEFGDRGEQRAEQAPLRTRGVP